MNSHSDQVGARFAFARGRLRSWCARCAVVVIVVTALMQLSLPTLSMIVRGVGMDFGATHALFILLSIAVIEPIYRLASYENVFVDVGEYGLTFASGDVPPDVTFVRYCDVQGITSSHSQLRVKLTDGTIMWAFSFDPQRLRSFARIVEWKRVAD